MSEGKGGTLNRVACRTLRMWVLATAMQQQRRASPEVPPSCALTLPFPRPHKARQIPAGQLPHSLCGEQSGRRVGRCHCCPCATVAVVPTAACERTCALRHPMAPRCCLPGRVTRTPQLFRRLQSWAAAARRSTSRRSRRACACFYLWGPMQPNLSAPEHIYGC